MKKIFPLVLVVLVLLLAVCSAAQYFGKQDYQVATGKAVIHISNNELNGLLKLETYIKNDKVDMAKLQLDQLIALVYYEIMPGGEFVWVHAYDSIESNCIIALSSSSEKLYTMNDRLTAKEKALVDISKLIELRRQINKLCEPENIAENIDPTMQLKERAKRYLQLIEPGSDIYKKAEELYKKTFV